jgi:hypothetical protein
VRKSGDGDNDGLGGATMSLFKTLVFGEFLKNINHFSSLQVTCSNLG